GTGHRRRWGDRPRRGRRDARRRRRGGRRDPRWHGKHRDGRRRGVDGWRRYRRGCVCARPALDVDRQHARRRGVRGHRRGRPDRPSARGDAGRRCRRRGVGHRRHRQDGGPLGDHGNGRGNRGRRGPTRRGRGRAAGRRRRTRRAGSFPPRAGPGRLRQGRRWAVRRRPLCPCRPDRRRLRRHRHPVGPPGPAPGSV
ncbi:MAG: TonB family protein / TonB-dependent receptor, partial [uncultured Thermomicrobiales bacterium]